VSKTFNQDILLDSATGKCIPNTQETKISHPLAANALKDSISFPSILRVNPNPKYNCHGLTFASKRTSILGDAEIFAILKEDDYREIQYENILPGDIAIYHSESGEIEHSAIIISIPTRDSLIPFVYSKWGVIGPEVIHLLNDNKYTEYSISKIRYYRMHNGTN
jgi:hypothetical protein